MTIPSLQPPTDNLYKFLAISGLLLFILSIVLPEWAIYNIRMQIIATEAESSALQFEVSSLERQTTILESQVDSHLASQSSADAPTTRNAIDHHDKGLAKRQLVELTGNLRKKLLDISVKNSQIEARVKTDKYMNSMIRRYLIVAVGASVIGFLLTVTGFHLWYFRLQRFLDHSVRSEAEKHAAKKEE